MGVEQKLLNSLKRNEISELTYIVNGDNNALIQFPNRINRFLSLSNNRKLIGTSVGSFL